MRRRRKLQRRMKLEDRARDSRIQNKIDRINDELRASADAEPNRDEKRAVEVVKRIAQYFFYIRKAEDEDALICWAACGKRRDGEC